MGANPMAIGSLCFTQKTVTKQRLMETYPAGFCDISMANCRSSTSDRAAGRGGPPEITTLRNFRLRTRGKQGGRAKRRKLHG